MQFLNRIELIGVVGRSSVIPVEDGKTINLAVVTEYAYRDSQNNPTVETQWFNVIYSGGGNYVPTRGDKIHVVGRITFSRYTDENGQEHKMTQVVAKNIEKILPETEVLKYENAENL
jgi:single-stranded DNA-binding protein